MIDEHLLRRLIEKVEDRFYGKYLGFIVDNQDPQRRGRLRVLVPEVLGDVISGWADPCIPYGGGANFGNFAIPPVTRDAGGEYTTGVWIEFRGGNLQYPIWVGTYWGAPGGKPEAPGDADTDGPTPGVHVARTFGGHGVVADDTAGKERLELRDASGQSLVFSAPLKEGTRRDYAGQPTKDAGNIDYPDLAQSARIELTDFAGNRITLDGTQGAPGLKLTNTGRDGRVLQTIELHGAAEDPKIVIRDNNDNVVTLDPAGIRIEARRHGSVLALSGAGITEQAPRINLNEGSQGVARLEDHVRSTIAEDPEFWTFIQTLVLWLSSHSHPGPGIPPAVPLPVPAPSKCEGKIVEASKTVLAGG